MEGSEEQITKNEKEDNVKEVGGMADGAIHKIEVIADDSLYKLDSSTDNLVIGDVSNSKDSNVKEVSFKANEVSTCESELNGDSKKMDSTADTVKLSTLTAESAVQDTTSQEEMNDTVSTHEDEEDCDLPLTQSLVTEISQV